MVVKIRRELKYITIEQLKKKTKLDLEINHSSKIDKDGIYNVIRATTDKNKNLFRVILTINNKKHTGYTEYVYTTLEFMKLLGLEKKYLLEDLRFNNSNKILNTETKGFWGNIITEEDEIRETKLELVLVKK